MVVSASSFAVLDRSTGEQDDPWTTSETEALGHPLRLHLGHGLLRKGNLSYSSLRCRRVHLGAASLGGTQASLLTWVAVASVVAASLFACPEILGQSLHSVEPQLLPQGPLGPQSQSDQEVPLLGGVISCPFPYGQSHTSAYSHKACRLWRPLGQFLSQA